MSLNPALAPLDFFRALHSQNYQQAWECLSDRSQTGIVKLLANSWKTHTYDELVDMFAKGTSVAKTYWEHFSRSLDLSTWLQQQYKPLGVSGHEVIVKASPTGAHLMVYQQGGQWKFGYLETFLDQQ